MAVRANEHHVRPVQWSRLIDDAGLQATRLSAQVPLDQVDPIHHHPVRFREHTRDMPAFALVLAGQYNDFIA